MNRNVFKKKECEEESMTVAKEEEKKWRLKMFTKVMKEELIAGLLKIFGNNISMIILYGSVARNEYTDESDMGQKNNL